MEKLEKIIKFTPAYDKRNPDPKKNYGVGSVRCVMVLKGEKGAVHFVFGTGMYLPQVYEWWERRGLNQTPNKPAYMGYDVGYHSHTRHYESQTVSQESCEWLDGKPCFSDGSALRAEEFMDVFVKEGEEKIWEMLEEDYKCHFEKSNEEES